MLTVGGADGFHVCSTCYREPKTFEKVKAKKKKPKTKRRTNRDDSDPLLK